jgi:hypothetical protein
MAHHGQPTYWTTPLGFPVMLRCPNTDTQQIDLFLHDKGIKIRVAPRSLYETGGISSSYLFKQSLLLSYTVTMLVIL